MKEIRNRHRYAIVDLEATGTGIDAKIIQIGIVLVEAGQIIETYSTDINPYEPLSDHIKELTGITDEQLRHAPDFGQVAGRIFDLIGQAIFVAHNVKFDANLLAEALFFEGYELLTPRVDTVELAQLFFPTLEKYSLSSLSDYLDLGLEQAHTALADALATAKLLVRIQDKMAQLPRIMGEQLLALADNLLYESRLVLDEMMPDLSEQLPEDCQLVHGLVLQKTEEFKQAYHLSERFETNLALLGLEEREMQAHFAQIVSERMAEENGIHFIQAQSGIGKTYGYLLPLLAQSDQPILVSVPTKLLQEQIMVQEGQVLADVFHISFSSIKSPQHYIKLDQFWKTLQWQDDNRLVNLFKMQVLVWLSETRTGDLDELKQKQRYQAYFDELAHDGQLSQESLFWQEDFWRNLQHRAASSRVLLTNHAYFLTHLKDQDPLMEGRTIVIDEAQKLLLAAENLASQSQNMAAIVQLLQSKKDKAENLLDKRLYESCQFELNQVVTEYRQNGHRDVLPDTVAQLRQNLFELQDEELRDLQDLLHHYDQFWLEEKLVEDKRVTFLRGTSEWLLDLSKYLPAAKIFCISATLDISKKVSLADLLGLSQVTVDYLPVKEVTNQQILLPRPLPDISSLSLEQHAQYLVERFGEIAELGRPILVLFTSIALLMQVAELLDETDLPYLAQHKHGSEMSLKRRFERGECQILLGTGVFWEGVDFSSQEELIQVIPRLPFDNPKDRFIAKINHRLRTEGKHPFYDYSLPMMMLKLKQAIGRTNRHQAQDSVVIILDDRIQTRKYGPQIISFLERTYPVQVTELSELGASIENFFWR